MLIDLEQLGQRDNSTGIITADRYVKSFVGCYEGASGPLCPAKLFEMESKAFDEMVKASSSRLTYSEIEPSAKIAGAELMVKARELAGDDRADQIEKALAVIECTMSITGEDRDGDMMHTKGMEVDPSMPFLWMHMQVQPIGAFIGKSHHDDKILKGMHAIAATKLGEDCVTLIEVGGLRTSIGFNPIEGQVSPRKTQTVNGRKKVLSWDVKGCRVMEDSAVSVPSCEGAVIESLHRNKLHDDYVKHWAKSISDGRPVIVPGIELETMDGLVTKGVDVPSECSCGGTCETCLATKAKGAKCSCGGKGTCKSCKAAAMKDGDPTAGGDDEAKGAKGGEANNTNSGDTADPSEKMTQLIGKGLSVEHAKAIDGLGDDIADLILSDRVAITPESDGEPTTIIVKSVEDGLTHKMYGMNDHYLPGSYEWICYKLDRMAKSFLVGAGVMDADDYGAGVVATFGSEAILCCGPWDKKRCFQVSYSIDEDGSVKFGGEVAEVEIKAEIVAKWFQVMAKRLAVFAEPVEPPTAIELARQLCAKTVDSDGDDTVGDALNMTAHAAEVFADHDEASLYGELLTAD